jgi:hypothetical protein
MHSSFQSTCTQFARVVPAIAALALLASCSLIVDDALNNAPAQPWYGAPAGCGYLCDGVNYARQAYPGGPCECPMFGATGGVPAGDAGGTGGMVWTTTCGPAMVLPGSIGACVCPNGDLGTQTCDWTGNFLTCICPILFVPDNDAGSDDDAGTASF